MRDLFSQYTRLAQEDLDRILSMRPTMDGSDVKLVDEPRLFPLAYGITGTGELRRFSEVMYERFKNEGIHKVVELVDDVNYGIQSDGWTVVVLHKAVIQRRRIFFNLNNMQDVPGMLAATGRWANGLTARELRYIRDNWDLFHQIISFWKSDVQVPPPWETQMEKTKQKDVG
jgi:hypothetical protein